jgi:Sec-independent protein translocase protein TatA
MLAGDVGIGELVLVAVAAFVLFGPETLARRARDAGRLVGRSRIVLASWERRWQDRLERSGSDEERGP